MNIRETISSIVSSDDFLHKSGVLLLMSWLISLSPLKVSFLAPIERALREFEYSDMVLSQIQAETPAGIDTSIVLVNVGLASHTDVAMTIESLRETGDACIGVDVMCTSPADLLGASVLRDAIRRTPNIVMAVVLSERAEEEEDAALPFRHRERGVLHQLPNSVFANVNLPASDTCETIRYWEPSAMYAGSEPPSMVRRLYEKTWKQSLPTSIADTELFVRYQRQRTWFTMEWSDCLAPEHDLSIVKRRVVLLGFLARTLADTMSLEDRFYTPQDKSYVGRAWPDMYGVEIRATVLPMLYHKGFVKEPSEWINLLIAFLLTALILAMYDSPTQRMHSFGETAMRVVKVVILSLVFGAMAILLLDYSILIPIDITVACTVLALDVATIYDGFVVSFYRRMHRMWRGARVRRYKNYAVPITTLRLYHENTPLFSADGAAINTPGC